MACRWARLSRDGKRVALDRVVLGNRDVYIRDLFNGAITRFTTDRSLDGIPVWSPNGSEIAFQSDRNGSYDIFVKSTAGTEPAKELLRAPGNQWALDWSRDGRWLLYFDGANAGDLWAMPMVGTDRTPVPIAHSPFRESDAALSPDGHWVAYPTNESGTTQIVVQSFPQAREKWSASVNGGLGPVWSANGRELFFVAPDGKLMVVPVQATSETFNYEAASALFQTRIVNTRPAQCNFPVLLGHGEQALVIPGGANVVVQTVENLLRRREVAGGFDDEHPVGSRTKHVQLPVGADVVDAGVRSGVGEEHQSLIEPEGEAVRHGHTFGQFARSGGSRR